MNRRYFLALGILMAFLLLVSGGCSDDTSNDDQNRPTPSGWIRLDVTAGSEARDVQAIIQQAGEELEIDVRMHYSGSVDMFLALKDDSFDSDVALPASSVWIDLGDAHARRVKNAQSIMRTPLILALKRSKAQELGWVDRDVTVAEILDAVSEGKLKFCMTSATQSNSGFTTYIAMLKALAGNPEVLTSEDLEKTELQEGITNLLSGVDRGSGSSGWLRDMFVEQFPRFDGMFIYESMAIAANRGWTDKHGQHNPGLIEQGHEPLQVIYIKDGTGVADCTMGYVDKPGDPDNDAKKAAFAELAKKLRTPQYQAMIVETGFRPAISGLPIQKDLSPIFNKDWGVDFDRVIAPFTWPSAEVTLKAMNLYQTAFRKPSLTFLALDFSGSMGPDQQGTRLYEMKQAVMDLFRPETSERYLIQTSDDDITVVIAFDHAILGQPIMIEGNDPQVLAGLVNTIASMPTREGNTNIYEPVAQAWFMMSKIKNLDNYLPAVILMTDGESNNGSWRELQDFWNKSNFNFDMPPVFSIRYGEADPNQLKQLAGETVGRVFDANKGGLAKAFRSAGGYN